MFDEIDELRLRCSMTWIKTKKKSQFRAWEKIYEVMKDEKGKKSKNDRRLDIVANGNLDFLAWLKRRKTYKPIISSLSTTVHTNRTKRDLPRYGQLAHLNASPR